MVYEEPKTPPRLPLAGEGTTKKSRRYIRLLLMAVFLIAGFWLLIKIPAPANAQWGQLPDCNVTPQHSFCQGMCQFAPYEPWCPQPTPSPSPSPTPTHDPIMIVPGITVSQNKKLLYKDQEGGKWKFAFGFNIYKGLITKLEQEGYEEGKDLLVAHYDWRKPAAHNATTYLKPIIDQIKQNTGANKVDVVAHSFGGIVTRAYIQDNIYANDIDQLITLGSPHRGSADSYVAWEGGIFPEGWKFWIINRVEKVEDSLKKTHNQKDLKRPASFRAYFPSLRDMLPTSDFVRRSGEAVAVSTLAEQNSWLKNLNESLGSIVSKGVSLTTIAGNKEQTLDKISLTGERSHEDEALARWRDGQPATIPPPLDSAEGDDRVMLASAHAGETNITLDNAEHHKLPDAAQDKVLDILGLNPVAQQFTTQEPKSIFGIIILSPLTVSIMGPNGKVLSANRNDFGVENAEYDDDPNDPDDPIEVTILNPPNGWYDLAYTGTGNGEYLIITSYADEDENVSSTNEGEATLGQETNQRVYIGNNTISLIDDGDYIALLKEIERLAKQAKKDKLISGNEMANVTRPVTHAQNDRRIYEQRMRQDREEAALERLRDYYQELDEIGKKVTRWLRQGRRAEVANRILELVEKIRLSAPVI